MTGTKQDILQGFCPLISIRYHSSLIIYMCLQHMVSQSFTPISNKGTLCAMIMISTSRPNDMLHIYKYTFIFSILKTNFIYSNCPFADFIATKSCLNTIKLEQDFICASSEEHKSWTINSSPPGQNGRHFAGDIFVKGKFCILIKMSLKFVPPRPIYNNSALV